MELRDIDLNLLVIFSELLRQGSVSAAAQTLGVSQPATSNALNRLRRLLEDDLFLRTPKGMEPTPFAESLAEPINKALASIHDSLNSRTSFDAASSTRSFTVAMTDIGEIHFLPPLMRKLSTVAPGITLSTVRNTAVNLRQEMEYADVDLAIGFLPDLNAGFFQRRVFSQSYVCLFRRDHPLAGRNITLEKFCAAEHVSIVADGTGHGMVDDAIQRAGITRKLRLRVPHFVAVGHILQTTDLIAVVPEGYATQTLEPFGLCMAPCPVEIPRITIHVLWHAKKHRDAANQWLREFIFEQFSD